jgi:uncharacterized protein
MNLEQRNGPVVDLRSNNAEKLHIPHFYASSVTAINFKDLHENFGVNYLVLDIEETIAKTGAKFVHPEIVDFLKEIVESGYVQKEIWLATNSRRKDLQDLADSIGAKIKIRTLTTKKPDKAFFDEIISEIGCQPEEAVMVGDKMTRDVLGARRAGMWTVLVDPLYKRAKIDYVTGVGLRELYWRHKLKDTVNNTPHKKTS